MTSLQGNAIKKRVLKINLFIYKNLSRILMIRLKSSKESRDFSRGIIIELFEHFGGDLCPVDAYEKYLESCGGSTI